MGRLGSIASAKRYVILVLPVFAMLLMQCSGTGGALSDSSGRSVAYTPGLPNFDMEAISTLRGGEPGFDLYIGIPRASLVYRKVGNTFHAAFEGVIQLLDEGSNAVLFERGWRDSVTTVDFEQTQVYETLLFHRRIPVEPGDYLVRCVLQDSNTEKNTSRVQELTVFALEPQEAGLSRIRLEGKSDEDPFSPIVALHVAEDVDSLRALVELYEAPEGRPTNVEMRLLKFRSDTEIAVLPHWISPMTGSLGYRGVDYRRPEIVQRTARRLVSPSDEIALEFLLPDLEQGVYRIEVTVTSPPDEDNETLELQQRRDVSVKPAGFPHVRRLDQIVETLTYIATDDELEEIQSAPTDEEMRERFDAFWGSLVPSRQVASNLMRQYFNRVEEANLMFTSHKAGWKTDRGMVYVVLGAPLYVEYYFDTEVWYYAYSDRDPRRTFVFKRVRAIKGQETFQNFLLVRRPYYERTWIRAVRLWRNGSVL